MVRNSFGRMTSWALMGIAGIAFSAAAPVGTLAQEKSASKPAESPLASTTWKDVTGLSYDLSQLAQNKATVFFFSSTQCPISNVYTPRMIELAQAFQPKGVRFFLVNANREDSLETVKKYAEERKFPFPAVKDNGTELADRLSAQATPQAIILDSGGIVRYRGRIDDNKDREKVIRHDVQAALDDLVHGRPVARPRTLAFGCTIFRDDVKLTPLAQTVTYTRDVAPILNGNCVSCHRKGEVGPFPLETYPEARTWSRQIRDYTARRLMPPWKPVPGHGDFRDARILSDKQIAMLAKWVNSGMPQGDLKDLPPAPKFASLTDWTLGKPDLTLQPSRPYHLAAEGKDVYREYILPLEAKGEDLFIRGVEFRPGNRRIVHHVILYFDPTGATAKLDGKEAEPGYSVPGTGIGVGLQEAIFVAGWAPGGTPFFVPTGTAVRLKPGWKAVLQVHYYKTGQTEEDLSTVAIHFADKKKVEREIFTAGVANPYLLLKPGVAHQEVKASMTLPADVHIWSVGPHMHMLGKEMKLTATLPDGTQKSLIYVNDWDFNQQDMYHYKKPVALPKGTRIDLLAVFDNSEQNPRQMSHPPRQVSWGEQTIDEMCIGFFQITVDKQNLLVKGAKPLTDSDTE